MDYITITSIKHKLWTKLVQQHPDVLQYYVDIANRAVEDQAFKHNLDADDLMTPIHMVLELYAINIALKRFAYDRTSAAGTNSSLGEDSYKDLYDLATNEIKTLTPQINVAVITGKNQNSTTRATSFGKRVR